MSVANLLYRNAVSLVASTKEKLGSQLTKVNRFNFYFISKDPLVLVMYTPSGLDHIIEIAKSGRLKKPCVFLIFFNWYLNPLQIISIEKQVHEIQKLRSNFRVIPLLNSKEEAENFNRLAPKLPSHHINQNITLNENIFACSNSLGERSGAIINSRMQPFKRLELARNVENLSIITCGWTDPPSSYQQGCLATLSSAEWLNLDHRGVYTKLSVTRIVGILNRCRAGLILSRREGACFAATEFLLCGVPVVSTESRGGRDELFTPQNSLIVDDDPVSVANGVKEIIERKISPLEVRRATLLIIDLHRQRFFDLLENIFGDLGSHRNVSRDWQDLAPHKMLQFTELERFFERVGE